MVVEGEAGNVIDGVFGPLIVLQVPAPVKGVFPAMVTLAEHII